MVDQIPFHSVSFVIVYMGRISSCIRLYVFNSYILSQDIHKIQNKQNYPLLIENVQKLEIRPTSEVEGLGWKDLVLL